MFPTSAHDTTEHQSSFLELLTTLVTLVSVHVLNFLLRVL